MAKINYKEFVEIIKEEVQKLVSETVKVENVEKGNGKILTGLCFHTGEERYTSPILYLESYYIQYLNGISINELAKGIIDFYEEAKIKISPKMDELFVYGNVRNKVALKLINTERNKRLLSDVPHKNFKDLSIVFYLMLEETQEATATMLIRKGHIKKWGVDTETLWSDAMKNQVSQARLYTMTDKLQMLMDEKQIIRNLLESESYTEPQDAMYVLTNSQEHYGAASLIYPGVLEKIRQIVRGDFFVLPSSVHELIIVPHRDNMDVSEINQMIYSINQEHVELEEILSDHCYYYNGEITIP